MNRDGGPAVRWNGIGGLREAREASQSACVDAQKTLNFRESDECPYFDS
jgi:hypothetical protein